MLKRPITKDIFWAVAIVVMGLFGIAAFCLSDGNKNQPDTTVSDSNSSQAPSKPMIIWWARLWDDHEALRLAASSGVFSHVMLVSLHEFDRPIDVILTNPNLKKALKLCKQKGVKIVWTRWLYPGYKFKGFTLKDALDAQYYANRIRNIREEAKRIGVDLVAFDAEPYANSPLLPLKTLVRCELSRVEFEAMSTAIQTAIELEGQVDFVLPAGTRFRGHLYDATRNLGKLAISEHTYYDVPRRRKAKRTYDIFGAYVSTSKQNKKYPKLTFFTPKEILSRQELWAHKKGLFVYPGSAQNAVAIARQFSQIKVIRPVRDSNDVK